MKKEKKIDNVRYRKFAPIDRNSPIFEILLEDEIVMDISKSDCTDEIEIMFHKAIAYKYVTADLLFEIIRKGKSLIRSEE